MLFNEENVNTQTIYLSFQGELLSSCNSLFDTKLIAPYPALQGLPLLQSVLQAFEKQPFAKIHLPRIETNYADLPGFYDFTFEAITVGNRSIIRWIIYDFTKVYETLQRKQQQRHEKDIKRNLEDL